MKPLITLISLVSLLPWGFAQPLALLHKIGQPPYNTQSGLSQIFNGDLLKDENVYFLGSHDGLTRHLWRTNGTPAGTIKIFSETSIDSWKAVRFVEDGVFFNISDHLVVYQIGLGPIRNLGPFPDVRFIQTQKVDTSQYIFLTNRNDTAGLAFTDMTAAGSFYIGDVGAYHGFMTLYAGPYGAVVYNTNPFVNYEPMMYDAMADTLLTVMEFLAPYKAISSVKKVAMYDQYLFLEVSESGTKQYVFDLRSRTFYPGQYFFGVIEQFYQVDEALIIVSEREITIMDTATYAFTEYTDEVFPLGTHMLAGDKMYYHGYSTNDTVYVYMLDLVSGKISRLPNGQIGRNYYSSQFAIHDGELYYLRDFGPTTFLTRYDFNDSVAVDIDSITIRNSGLVINNALLAVSGELLVSKFSPEQWHELYFLENTTFTHDQSIEVVSVFPNPCGDVLNITISDASFGEVFIWNASGQIVIKQELVNGSMQTQHLTNGMYHGIAFIGGKELRFSFFKQK